MEIKEEAIQDHKEIQLHSKANLCELNLPDGMWLFRICVLETGPSAKFYSSQIL